MPIPQRDTAGRYGRLVADPDPGRLLVGLRPEQQRAVTSDAGLLCVVAGAGSGKTTVLTRRVAWRVVSGSARAEHVLVVTFTRKAAAQLRSRLERLGVGAGAWAATFHSAAYRILRRHWADSGRAAPSMIGDREGVLRRLLEESAMDPELATAVAGELSWARARLIRPERYPDEARLAGRSCPLPAGHVASVMERYEEHKRQRRVIDLDDVIDDCTALLEAGDGRADALRWQVQHLFVDEFQDVNPAQWRMLEALRHGRPDLCVVGDPRQAIYAWNGSDPSLLEKLPSLVGGIEVVRLDVNHRSSPQVVRAASAVLSSAPRPPEGAVPLPCASPAEGTQRADGSVPVVRGFDDETSEALAVSRWLRTTRRPGHPWRQLVVLARTNARLGAVSEALTRSGIPWRRAGAGDDPALAAVVRSLRAMAQAAPLRAALVDVLSEVGGGPSTTGDILDELASRLGELAEEHAADEARPDVGSFISWLAANRPDAGGDDADAVVLATFHQAKGLEWPAVAVIGLEEGTLPIAYAADPAALAEERRLLYVALTRAEEHLWCSWAASAGHGARRRRRGPSRFLAPLRVAVDELKPIEPEAARPRVAELRKRLAGVG